MSKDQWIMEYELIGESFASDEITREEAEARMKALGVDPDEIQNHLDAVLA
jgi:hypothetical protein